MSKHTPTPWSYSGTSGDTHIMGPPRAGGRRTIAEVCPHNAVSLEEQDANKEFIVRACNSHDALVAAAKEFCRKVECGEARSRRSYAQFKAALASARES